MKHAVYAPIFNDYADPKRLVELAVLAEDHGYDGFFLWDHLAFEPDGRLELADAMTTLGAIACRTERIRFGPMITPLARRRPWKVAKELTTLDTLSGGRLTFGVGLGEPTEIEFARFGEDPSGRVRAAKLDEGLQLIDQFLQGSTVNFDGEYFSIREATLAPRSVQHPRCPIWVAASLPARAGLRRATRWDGCFPVKVPASILDNTVSATEWREWWLTVDDYAYVAEFIRDARGSLDGFDLIAAGSTLDSSAAEARSQLAAVAATGATWWFEWLDDKPGHFDAARDLIARGPVTGV